MKIKSRNYIMFALSAALTLLLASAVQEAKASSPIQLDLGGCEGRCNGCTAHCTYGNDDYTPCMNSCMLLNRACCEANGGSGKNNGCGCYN